MAPVLLMAAPAPVIPRAGGKVRLDKKFLDGMARHLVHWPGPVRVILWRGAQSIPFAVEVVPQSFGFDLFVLAEGEHPPPAVWEGVRVFFASADDLRALALLPAARAAQAKVVLALEYTLETRLRIAALEQSLSWPKRLWSMAWNLAAEGRRRGALQQADGVQFNGYPAFDAYCARVRNPLLYLDNRMTPALMATPSEMAVRRTRLSAGAPLRLIYSGRLEPMKGAQDLLPIMHHLRAKGVAATLDIYGTGSLAGAIEAGLGAFEGQVRLHGPVDFAETLVPRTRNEADLFLACHRQSDPSCTYLEAMGCGVAIVGYANRMWARLAQESGAGPVVPLGKPEAMAEAVAALDADRKRLIAAQERARAFAAAHDFETEFAARMAHLRSVAGL